MLMNSNEYLAIADQIKQEIKAARYRSTLHINQELILLYYNIGTIINDNKRWGNKFIENLAKDIKIEFPDATGYSVRNLGSAEEVENVLNTYA